jgi:hypothetical protein
MFVCTIRTVANNCFTWNGLLITLLMLLTLQHKAVPWLRRLVADLSLRRPGFDSGSVHVGVVVDKVALGQVFPPSTSVFPCQFHSTGAPLLGKMEKTNHLSLHHGAAQYAFRLRCQPLKNPHCNVVILWLLTLYISDFNV